MDLSTIDWRLVLGLVNFVILIIVFLFSKYSHDKIVYNDLTHLSADIKTVIEKQDKAELKFTSLAIDVSYLKGVSDSIMKSPKKASRKKPVRKVRAYSKCGTIPMSKIRKAVKSVTGKKKK